MNKDEALDFLRQNQPLPSGDALTWELCKKYDEAREYFVEHPEPECIPLFLNSFGGRNCTGRYQVVDEVLWPHPKEVVLPQDQEDFHTNTCLLAWARSAETLRGRNVPL